MTGRPIVSHYATATGGGNMLRKSEKKTTVMWETSNNAEFEIPRKCSMREEMHLSCLLDLKDIQNEFW